MSAFGTNYLRPWQRGRNFYQMPGFTVKGKYMHGSTKLTLAVRPSF